MQWVPFQPKSASLTSSLCCLRPITTSTLHTRSTHRPQLWACLPRQWSPIASWSHRPSQTVPSPMVPMVMQHHSRVTQCASTLKTTPPSLLWVLYDLYLYTVRVSYGKSLARVQITSSFSSLEVRVSSDKSYFEQYCGNQIIHVHGVEVWWSLRKPLRSGCSWPE